MLNGLNLSPLMFIIVTGMAGIGCGYFTYRSIVRKESWMRTAFWFMWSLAGICGAAGEILRSSNPNSGLVRILDETFAVAAMIGFVVWIWDWLTRNTNFLKKFW